MKVFVFRSLLYGAPEQREAEDLGDGKVRLLRSKNRCAQTVDVDLCYPTREAAMEAAKEMVAKDMERLGKELASLARDLRRLNKGEFPGERVGSGKRKED